MSFKLFNNYYYCFVSNLRLNNNYSFLIIAYNIPINMCCLIISDRYPIIKCIVLLHTKRRKQNGDTDTKKKCIYISGFEDINVLLNKI